MENTDVSTPIWETIVTQWMQHKGVDIFVATFESVGCYENYKVAKLIFYLNGFNCRYWYTFV
jgi:hypothetical protein